MKIIFRKWWDNGNKLFSITNYNHAWKVNGIKPSIKFQTNGAKKGIDKCLDSALIIGYTIFNYVDFNYSK